MTKWIFIGLLLIFASCKKDTSSTTTTSDLSIYEVFNEELKTVPIFDNGFIFLAKKDSSYCLEKVDTNGIKQQMLTLTLPTGTTESAISNFTLLSPQTSNYLVLFTYSGTYASTTTQLVQATKIKDSKKEWDVTFPISTNISKNFTLIKVLSTENGGFMTIASLQNEGGIDPKSRSITIEFSYYNAQGILENSYSNTNVKEMETTSKITRFSDGTIIVMPSATMGGGQKNAIVFTATAAEFASMENPLSITDIHDVITNNDTIIIAGANPQTAGSPSKIIALSSSGGKLWEQSLVVPFSTYSISKFSGGYVLTGTEDANLKHIDNSFYTLSSGSNIAWIITNSKGENAQKYQIEDGEYLSTAVGSFVTPKNNLCILGAKKSFGLYNNIVFLKTVLKKQP